MSSFKISNYQTSDSREASWTKTSCDPTDNLLSKWSMNEIRDCNSFKTDASYRSGVTRPKNLLTAFSAAIFIAGEMAGSGVLALPRAVADAGWIGIVLVVVLCINAGFGGTRLGMCWTIVEERYPEFQDRTRNPYASIALKAVGRKTSLFVSGCVQFTLFGAGTVYMLLASQIVQDLLRPLLPNIGFCVWFLVIAAALCPAMWLGTPKDFWAVGVGALATTAFACVFIFSQIVIDSNHVSEVVHTPHGFESFFLAFGTILFAFGGASTFPTIQNDMKRREKFPVSVTVAFCAILIMYLPIAAGGYFVYGDFLNSNIILSLTHTGLVTAANVLLAIHLVLAFLIIINPVCQELEEMFNVPHKFHWKRCLLRTMMLLIMVFLGESVPRFGKILALVGGSTITMTTFVFPPLFYILLCDKKEKDWPQRTIPLHVRFYLWELIIIGLFGGAASTYSAILAIFGPNSMTKPCYVR